MIDIAALFDVEYPALCRYFQTRLRDDQAVADDLASETMARAWAKRATYHARPGIPARCWLFSIARNLLIDHRRRKRSISLDRLGAAGCHLFYTLRMEELADRSRIRAAVERLPERQRVVIVGRFYERRKSREIGPETAVKKLQQRALARLRKDLKAA